MKNNLRLIVMLYILILTSLFVGCGSAEAIKGYKYPVTKDVLEKAVMKVIKSNPILLGIVLKMACLIAQ